MSDIYNYVRIYEILFFLASTYSDVAHPSDLGKPSRKKIVLGMTGYSTSFVAGCVWKA